MNTVLLIAQITISITLIVIILVQSSGSGLGSAFGGSEGVYRSKRGVEKLFVFATIGLSALFFAVSVLRLALS